MNDLERVLKVFPPGYLSYPKPPDRPLRWVLQWHFRGGRSLHGDMRFEQQDDLVGFTLAVQLPGLNVQALDDLETASVEAARKGSKKQSDKFKIDPFTGKFRTRRDREGVERRTSVVAVPKSRQPKVWLDFEGVSPPKEVGATANLPGTFWRVAHGTYSAGARKPSLWEVFIEETTGAPGLVGRLFWRPLLLERRGDKVAAKLIGSDEGNDLIHAKAIQEIEDLVSKQDLDAMFWWTTRAGVAKRVEELEMRVRESRVKIFKQAAVEELRIIRSPVFKQQLRTLPPSGEVDIPGITLLTIQPDSQLPNVLSKSSREDRPFVPPQGWSALPRNLRENVPPGLRYWTKKDEGDRLRLRDQLHDQWKDQGIIATLEKGEEPKFKGSTKLVGRVKKLAPFSGGHDHPHAPNGQHDHPGLPQAGGHAHIQADPTDGGGADALSGPLDKLKLSLGGHRHRDGDPIEGVHIGTVAQGEHDTPVALDRPPALPIDLLVEIHETRPWLPGFKRAIIRERETVDSPWGDWREWSRFDGTVHALHPTHWTTDAFGDGTHEAWFGQNSPTFLIDKRYEFVDGKVRRPALEDWESEKEFITAMASRLAKRPLDEFTGGPFDISPVSEGQYVVEDRTGSGPPAFELAWEFKGFARILRMAGDLRQTPRVEANLIEGDKLAGGEFSGEEPVIARGQVRVFESTENRISLELVDGDDVDRIIARRLFGDFWIVAGGKMTDVGKAFHTRGVHWAPPKSDGSCPTKFPIKEKLPQGGDRCFTPEAAKLYRDSLAKQVPKAKASGPKTATLAVIGDGPGRIELENEEAFTGVSGKFMRDTIKRQGADPDKVYFDNVFRVAKLDPLKDEDVIKEGQKRLRELFDTEKFPNLLGVMVLGETAALGIFGPARTFKQLRGKTLIVKEPTGKFLLVMFPTWHPAAVVRAGRRQSSKFRQFVRQLRKALKFARMIKGTVSLPNIPAIVVGEAEEPKLAGQKTTHPAEPGRGQSLSAKPRPGDKFEKQKSGQFVLQRRFWRVREVVREGPVKQFWHLRLDLDGRFSPTITVEGNPLRSNSTTGVYDRNSPKRFFDRVGTFTVDEIEAPKPKKVGTVTIEELDRGKAELLVDDPKEKVVRLAGRKLQGVFIIRDEGGGVWSLTRRKAVGGLSKRIFREWEHLEEMQIAKRKGNPEQALRIAWAVVYEPFKVDLQGDWADDYTIARAAWNWAMKGARFKVMHRRDTVGVRLAENYVTKMEGERIGRRKLRKGTWVVAFRVDEEGLWADIKSGRIRGVSLGGRSNVRENVAPVV